MYASNSFGQPIAHKDGNKVAKGGNKERAAQRSPKPDANLSAQLRANHLLVHNAWVERESKSSNGWGKEGRHIGVFSRRTDLVFLGVCFGTNVNLDAYGSVRLDCFSFGVFTIERNPERVVQCRRVAIHMVHPGILFLWFHHIRFVVVFVDAQGSLGQNNIIESLREVDCQLTNHCVRGEEVSVVALNCKFPVLTVRHHSEN